MQTQQIINAPTGNFFFGTASAGSAGKTVDNTFEKMFQASSEKYETFSANDSKPTVAETTVASKTPDEKATEPIRLSKEENAADSVKETEQNGTLDEKELAERVAEVVAQVTQIVKDVLKITSEQLEETMNLLGISEADLLNTDVLKQMVLAVNGEQDMAAFLTNGDLLGQMQQLVNEAEELLEKSGFDFESLSSLLEDADFTELFENAINELALANTKEEADVLTEQEAQADVTVVKETQIEFRTEISEAKTELSENKTDANAEQTESASLKDDAGFANQFIQNLQNAVAEGVKEAAFGTDLAAQIREIANQILEQVRVVVAPEMTSLEIQLTPEHLGKVNITVTEQDGVMKASFVTDNELAKEAIESNLIQFKQMMNEQGIRVESVEVTVSEFTFDKNSEAGQSAQEEKKHGKAHFVMEEETSSVSMQDEIALHFMEGGESTVNYMA